MYDLANLIDYWSWPRNARLDLNEARHIVTEYSKRRQLDAEEQQHLYDVFKLEILIDCVWFFDRGNATDFYEKRKFDYLNDLGRDQFYRKLFT